MLLSRTPDTSSSVYQALFEQEKPLDAQLGTGGFATIHKIRGTDLVAKISCLTEEVFYFPGYGQFSKPVGVGYETEGKKVTLTIEGQERQFDEESDLPYRMRSALLERGVLRYIQESDDDSAKKARPHLCRLVDDYFVMHGGDVYLVLVEEYVPGRSFRGEKCDEVDVAQIAYHMSSVFDCFEKIGVVHRDIKPSQLRGTLPSGTRLGTTVLLDFNCAGFSKRGFNLLREEMTKRLFLEQEVDMAIRRFTLGTVHYQSPEQNRLGEIDYHHDLFPFGLVLTELLTGQRVNNAPTTSAIIRTAVNQPEELQRRARELLLREGDIDPDLRSGIEALLAVQPSERTIGPIKKATERILLDLGYDLSVG